MKESIETQIENAPETVIAFNGDEVFVIDDATCIECGSCRRYCPVPGAIIIEPMAYQHTVVADMCIGCGICEAFCPVPETIFKVPRSVAESPERLQALRRSVWRTKWHYQDHPVMGPLTAEAVRRLRGSGEQAGATIG